MTPCRGFVSESCCSSRLCRAPAQQCCIKCNGSEGWANSRSARRGGPGAGAGCRASRSGDGGVLALDSWERQQRNRDSSTRTTRSIHRERDSGLHRGGLSPKEGTLLRYRPLLPRISMSGNASQVTSDGYVHVDRTKNGAGPQIADCAAYDDRVRRTVFLAQPSGTRQAGEGTADP